MSCIPPKRNNKLSKKEKGISTKDAIKEVEKDYSSMLPSIVWSPVDEPVSYNEQPTQAKLWARWAWFSGKYSIAVISESIEAPYSTVHRWVTGSTSFKGWSQEKGELDRKYITKIIKDRSKEINDLLGNMLEVMKTNIEGMIDKRAELSVSEITQLSAAYERLFKTKQLSEGRPTDIQGRLTTWEDVKKRLVEVDILDYEKVATMRAKNG